MSARARWLVLALALLAFALRAAPLRHLYSGPEQRAAGAPQLLLTDPRTALELRAVEVALAQHELLLVDRALFHPLGDVARDAPGLSGALALALQACRWKSTQADPSAANAPEWLAVVLPPLWGALLVLFVAALASRFGPPQSVLWAALAACLWTPGSLAGQLHAGTPATLLGLAAILCFAWGLASSSDFDRVLGGVVSGGLAGLGLFTSLSIWPLLLAAHVALSARAARVRGSSARDLHRSALLHAGACALVLATPARSSPWNLSHPGTLQALSTAWLALLLGFGAGHGLALFLFRRGIEERASMRALLPWIGALALLAYDARAALLHGLIEPSPQVLQAVWPVAAALLVPAAPRVLLLAFAASGSWLFMSRQDPGAHPSLLTALRALRTEDGERGAWPAAGAAHPAGVMALEHAALVPYHARRAVLPGAYPASRLDTRGQRELRARIAAADRAAGAERDGLLQACDASHELRRDADGRWSARRLAAPPATPSSISAPRQ
jgi:hypothetical protein